VGTAVIINNLHTEQPPTKKDVEAMVSFIHSQLNQTKLKHILFHI
jgi:hypothetical protein